MNNALRKMINVAIAVLAITVCFQIISVNKYRFFSDQEEEVSLIRDKIVTALEIRDETKIAAHDVAPSQP